MFVLGALPGAINVLGWQALNTWCALVQGQFKANHPSCHSIADMGQLVGGRVVKEITGVLFLVAFIIVGASGMVGVSTALNALSEHSLCTNYFSIIAALMVGLCASVRRFEKLTWITWAGFASVFIAVFIVVYVSHPPLPFSPSPTSKY
jgi:carbon starvation protein CstA